MFRKTLTSCKGEQYNFCIGIFSQHYGLFAGFRWMQVIGESAYLEVGGGHSERHVSLLEKAIAAFIRSAGDSKR